MTGGPYRHVRWCMKMRETVTMWLSDPLKMRRKGQAVAARRI